MKYVPTGILIQVNDLAATKELFCGRLKFETLEETADTAILRSGAFKIFAETAKEKNRPAETDLFAGIEHIALATPDCAASLKDPMFEGLDLNTDNGAPILSPEVYGPGTLYFDFFADDNKVEICQRLDKAEGKLPCEGLTHLGMSSSDHRKIIGYYKDLGFEITSDVELNDEMNGHLLITMLNKDGFEVEVYHICEVEPEDFDVNAGCIRGIVFECDDMEGAAKALEETLGEKPAEDAHIGGIRLSFSAPDNRKIYLA